MSTILIVDDHEQNRYLLRTLLTASGYEVLEAANGAEALELARRTHPDLIISDILMPQMDGFALCRECKQDETLHDIPFVFYTATYTDPRDEALGLQLGAARFIVKPINNEEFMTILREVLQAHQAGGLTASQPPLEEETVFYRLYNEALIRKLEDKMLELEAANRALEDDIAQRIRTEAALRQMEAQLHKLNRMYALLSSVNQSIVRLREPQAIFERVCQLAVQNGGLRIAWVGLTDAPAQPLRVVARAGGADAYFDRVHLALQEGCTGCPMSDALRTGQYAICNKLTCNTPCCKTALALGARAAAAFPLQVSGQIRGVIGFYAAEENFFDQRENELLREMALDVSFAIEFAEKDAARRQAEEALRENQVLFTQFIRHSPIYAFIKVVTPTESRVVASSENYREMIGIPGDEMVGKTMAELFPPEFAAKITADDWAVVSQGNLLVLDEDFEGRNYTTIKFPIVVGEKTYLAGYTIDITARKQAEQKLAEQLDELRRWHAATLGREGRILELKREVNELLAQMGQPPRYPSVVDET